MSVLSTVSGSPAAAGVVDGRTARRDRNRELVLQTIDDLIVEGVLPTAAVIAERSGVSERSLFRIFGSREGLFLAAIGAKVRELEGMVQPLPSTGPLDQRLRAFCDQRSRFYEAVTPVRRFAEHFAVTSPAVAERMRATRAVLRAQVEATFTPELEVVGRRERAELLAALDAAASWETWNHLRQISGFPVDRARLVYGRTLAVLLGAPGRFRPA